MENLGVMEFVCVVIMDDYYKYGNLMLKREFDEQDFVGLDLGSWIFVFGFWLCEYCTYLLY